MIEEETDELVMRAYEVHAAAAKGTTKALLTTFENVENNAKTYTFTPTPGRDAGSCPHRP